MNRLNIKRGNFIKIEGAIGEVIALDNDVDLTVQIKTIDRNIVGKFNLLAIEPIYLERKLLTECCGFNEDGILSIDIEKRDFYLMEKEGYIILMGNNRLPLIHFWDITTLHQFQNLYSGLTKIALVVELQCLSSFIYKHKIFL